MWERLGRTVLLRWSLPLTGLLIVLAAIGSWYGSKVQLKLSLTDLLPERHPAVVKFEELTKVVGGVGYLAVLLEAQDGKSHLQIAPTIADDLRKNEGVRTVFFQREERFFVDRMLYYMDIPQLEELATNIDTQVRTMRRQFFDIGLFDEEEGAPKKPVAKEAFDDDLKKMATRSASITAELISKDRKHLLVMVKPSFDSTDIGKTTKLIADTRKILAERLPAGVRYDFTERYYNKIVETEIIQSDIFVLGGLSILLIALILLIYLRSFRGLLVIFLPVFFGLGITMGLTYLWIGHINIITGFLIGIVSGLGVDYGIHLYLRLLLEHREPSSSDPDPIWRTLSSGGHSVFTGAMAAAFAFYFLCFSSFRAFSEFGFVCGTGITAVLLCLLVSFRTLVRLLKLDNPAIAKKEQESDTKKRGKLRMPVLGLPRGFVIGIVTTVVAVTLGAFVRFEYDLDKMMAFSPEMERLSNLVDEIYGRSAVPSALATQDKAEALAIEKVLKDKYMPGTVKDLISGASIVPEKQLEKQAILQRIDRSLANVKDKFIEKALDVPASAVRGWVAAKPFAFDDLPQHIRDALRGTQGSGYLLYLYPAIKLSEATSIRKYASMVKDLEHSFPNVLTGSDAVIFSDILDLIERDGSRILLVIFLSVFFFIWINVRRWDDTLTSYIPLLVSVPVGMGLMALFGVRFNIFNISIIPTFVAMGIDVPIHVVHRARETGSGFKAARDLAPSIHLALMTAGIGFGVLVFARAGILKSLGWIALLGTVAIWWVGMLVLPAFLEWSGRAAAKRRTNTPIEV